MTRPDLNRMFSAFCLDFSSIERFLAIIGGPYFYLLKYTNSMDRTPFPLDQSRRQRNEKKKRGRRRLRNSISRHSIVTTRPPCLFVFSPHIQWISPRFQSNPVHHIRSPGCQKRNKETKRKLWKESEEVGTVGRTDFFPPFCPFWGQNGNVSWSPLPAANHGERSRFWFLLCTFN